MANLYFYIDDTESEEDISWFNDRIKSLELSATLNGVLLMERNPDRIKEELKYVLDCAKRLGASGAIIGPKYYQTAKQLSWADMRSFEIGRVDTITFSSERNSTDGTNCTSVVFPAIGGDTESIKHVTLYDSKTNVGKSIAFQLDELRIPFGFAEPDPNRDSVFMEILHKDNNLRLVQRQEVDQVIREQQFLTFFPESNRYGN